MSGRQVGGVGDSDCFRLDYIRKDSGRRAGDTVVLFIRGQYRLFCERFANAIVLAVRH
jgi:hypothetical protein